MSVVSVVLNRFLKMLKKCQKKLIFWIFFEKQIFCDADVLAFFAKTICRMKMVASAKIFFVSSSFECCYF